MPDRNLSCLTAKTPQPVSARNIEHSSPFSSAVKRTANGLKPVLKPVKWPKVVKFSGAKAN